MKKIELIIGTICLALAVIIFIYAEGLRRWYSGMFFAIIAVAMFLNAWRRQRIADKQDIHL